MFRSLATAIVVGLCAPHALAQKHLYTVRGNAGDGFGSALRAAGDVNKDGITDLIVGAPRSGSGYVQVLSGKDGKVLYTKNVAQHWFGSVVGAAGDVNGDGHDDFIATASGHYANPRTVWVYSGSDGKTLLRLTPPLVNWHYWFGDAVDGIGDVNKDGVPDIVVGSIFEGQNAQAGAARAYSGKDGKLLFTIKPGYQVEFVSGVGDVSSDGFPDILLGGSKDSWRYGQPFASVHSGRNGATLRTFQGPTEIARWPRYSVSRAGDVNRDGAADYFLAKGGEWTDVMSGRGGRIRRHTDSQLAIGPAASSVGDVNGDKYPDYVIGGWERVRLYSGRDGGLILEQKNPNKNDWFGYQVAALGDVNRDGVLEYAVGAPQRDQAPGFVQVMSVFTFDTRAAYAQLFQPTGPFHLPTGRLVGGTPPLVGAMTHQVAVARSWDVAVLFASLGAVSETLLPIPKQPLLFYLNEQALLYAVALPVVGGTALFPLPLPNDSRLCGVDLAFQAALVAKSGGFGATNLLLANLGAQSTSGSTIFAAPFDVEIAPQQNYQNLLQAPVEIYHHRGNGVFLSIAGTKLPGVGPIEVRTAPGKPPTGGGQKLASIPAAGGRFSVRFWLAPTAGVTGVYLLNMDKTQKNRMKWSLVVD